MTNRILQGMKVLLTSLALVTICAAQDVKPGADAGSASVDHRMGIVQTSPRPKLLVVKAEALDTGTITREDLDGLERTLSDYQSAFESLSLPDIYGVWPGLDHKREAALREVFKFLQKTTSAPRLDLQCTVPAAAALTVALDCREAVTYSLKDKKPTTVGPVRVSIKLRKESDVWFVETMKGL